MVKLKTNKTSTKEKMTKKTTIKTQRFEFKITKQIKTIVYLRGYKREMKEEKEERIAGYTKFRAHTHL